LLQLAEPVPGIRMWGEAEVMQAAEYDVEAERRAMKYQTLESVQTMIGKRCGKPWRGGQR